MGMRQKIHFEGAAMSQLSVWGRGRVCMRYQSDKVVRVDRKTHCLMFRITASLIQQVERMSTELGGRELLFVSNNWDSIGHGGPE
jgi:hypothetical protein